MKPLAMVVICAGLATVLQSVYEVRGVQQTAHNSFSSNSLAQTFENTWLSLQQPSLHIY